MWSVAFGQQSFLRIKLHQAGVVFLIFYTMKFHKGIPNGELAVTSILILVPYLCLLVGVRKWSQRREDRSHTETGIKPGCHIGVRANWGNLDSRAA